MGKFSVILKLSLFWKVYPNSMLKLPPEKSLKLGMFVHACNPRLRQEDSELQDRLGYTASPKCED
jgi:hypothetical protein